MSSEKRYEVIFWAFDENNLKIKVKRIMTVEGSERERRAEISKKGLEIFPKKKYKKSGYSAKVMK